MKENNFKFRESFGRAILPMSDKQAGQLLKGLCGYAFDGKPLITNDCAVKSTFTLIKTAIKQDERDRENGRRGGIISAEMNRLKNSVLVVTDIKEQDCAIDKILQDVLSDIVKAIKNDKGESVAKT